MSDLLQVLIVIVRLTAGQRFSIYNRMRSIAERTGPPVLLRRIELAQQHEKELQELENHWSATARRGIYSAEVGEVDTRVDHVLTSVRDIAVSQAAGLEPEHPMTIASDGLLAEIFPHGVGAVTSLPYVDQVMAVEVIVGKLQNGLSGTVVELGLSARVALLVELTAEYRRLVDLSNRTTGFAEIRAARDLGQQYLREIIAIVLGTFFDSGDTTHVVARGELLEPVMDQLAVQRSRTRAQRRNASSVAGETDGDTGESVGESAGEPAGDTGEPAVDEVLEAADAAGDQSAASAAS